MLPLLCIERQQVSVIGFWKFQSHHGCLLQRCGCSDGQEIMYLFRSLDHLLRSDQIAQSPASDGISLRKRITGNRVLVHTRKGRHADMLVRRIYHVLINLIRHNKSIIFDCQLSDLGQLFSGKYLSAWIGRVADDDRFRARLKALFYQIDIKFIRRRHQRNIDRLCP